MNIKIALKNKCNLRQGLIFSGEGLPHMNVVIWELYHIDRDPSFAICLRCISTKFKVNFYSIPYSDHTQLFCWPAVLTIYKAISTSYVSLNDCLGLSLATFDSSMPSVTWNLTLKGLLHLLEERITVNCFAMCMNYEILEPFVVRCIPALAGSFLIKLMYCVQSRTVVWLASSKE